jgi:hypothetical protein
MSKKSSKKRAKEAAAQEQTDPSLTQLAEEVNVVFPPVQPRPVLRDGLHEDLMGTMRNRATLRVVSTSERRRWAFIVGATVGSILPLCGLLAYLVYSRLMGKLRPATSQ